MADPLLRSVVVRCSPEHAFDTFTERIDLWWPRSHRRLEGSVLHLEPWVGGRFLERAPDGHEAVLGAVLAFERPSRLVYSWVPGSRTGPTHVEVTFSAGVDGTTVEVEHRPGEAADVFAERVALFDRAWSTVLPAFVDAIRAHP